MSAVAANQCFAHRQLCVCDRCDEEVQLINMAQWEFAEWESGISWCRRCFQMCGQFKTERNTGPRVPDKKKQAQVNTSVQKICTQHPVSWAECMTCIDAEFPDPTETCKFLQSDAKRVPKTSVGKHCELVAITDADAAVLKAQPVSPSLGPPKGAIAVGSARTSTDGATGRMGEVGSSQAQEAAGTMNPADGHTFAENLQAICQGEPVPPTAVAVMRTNDGRNSCSKKQPYLAFLLPEREYPRTYRFFRLNTINYYGNDACARFKSQCDCCEPLYMRFHIKEKKHQDEIKRLVQSKDIDRMFKGKRHDVHFNMEEDEEKYRQGVQNGSIKPGLGPFGMYQKPKGSAAAEASQTGKRTRPSKADDSGLKMCQFCDRRKPLRRFPMRLIMTCKGHAERKLGAHCKKCMIRSAHLRSNGYMRPHAQDLLKAYHSSKMKSARYTGNDSGSEDYEVDDNGMVEKQMRELGVDVIMHHTMVEDLAIQQAAAGSTVGQHAGAAAQLPPLAQALPRGGVKMGSRGGSLNMDAMAGVAEMRNDRHASKAGAHFSEQLQQALRTPLSATLRDEAEAASAMVAGGLVGAVNQLNSMRRGSGLGKDGDVVPGNPRKYSRSGRLGSDTEDEWQLPGSIAAIHKARSVGGSVELPHDAITAAAVAGMRAGSTELANSGGLGRTVPKLEADEMEAMPGPAGLTAQQSEQLVQQMLNQGRAPNLGAAAFTSRSQGAAASSQLGSGVPNMSTHLPDALAAHRLLAGAAGLGAGAAGLGADSALQNASGPQAGMNTSRNSTTDAPPAVPNAFAHEPTTQANMDKVLMDLTAQHEQSVLQLSALRQLQQEASQAPPSMGAPFASLTDRSNIAQEFSALQRGGGTQMQSAVEQQQQQQLALQRQLHQLQQQQTQQQLHQLTTELADAAADAQAATPRGQERGEEGALGADDLPLTWARKRHRTNRMPSNGAPDPLAVLTGQQHDQEPASSAAQGQAAALASMYQQQLRPLLNPQLELAMLSGGFQSLQQSQATDNLANMQNMQGMGAANGLQGLLGAAASAPAVGGVSGPLTGLGDLAGMSRLASVSQIPQLSASNMAQPLAGLDLMGLGQGLPNLGSLPQLGMQQGSQLQTGVPFSAHSVAQQVQQLPQQSVFGPRAKALQEQLAPRGNTQHQTSDPANSLALLHSLATNGNWK